MRRVRMRIFGLAVVAIMAIAAYTAGSAAALPEFGRCHASPTHEGKYTDSSCTVKAKKGNGEYEWEKSTSFVEGKNGNKQIKGNGIFEEAGPVGMTATFIKCEPNEAREATCGAGETEERVPVQIECENIRDMNAEFSSTSDKELRHYRVVIDGCHTLGGLECNNTGVQDELVLNELRGVLGYIKKSAPTEVGIAWKPEAGKEVANFTCGEDMRLVIGGATKKEGPFYPSKEAGSFIASVTPLNEMTSDVTQSAAVSAETGQNIPGNFEGKPLEALEAYLANPNGIPGNSSRWSPIGLTLTEGLSLCNLCDNVGAPEESENAEIKA